MACVSRRMNNAALHQRHGAGPDPGRIDVAAGRLHSPMGDCSPSGIKDPNCRPGVPDGMKCDAEGNVWVTAPGGVWVYASDPAPMIGKLAVPEMVANLHWGGAGLAHALSSAQPIRSTRSSKPRSARATNRSCRQSARPTSAYDLRAADCEGGLGSGSDRPFRGQPKSALRPDCQLDPSRCALIIQDMQNDVMMDGGAFRIDSGAPEHCQAAEQWWRTSRRLADACRRSKGVMVIHVWFRGRARSAGRHASTRPLFRRSLVDSQGSG